VFFAATQHIRPENLKSDFSSPRHSVKDEFFWAGQPDFLGLVDTLAKSGSMSENKNEKPLAAARSAYKVFRSITTRWMDNDAYGHVNNVVYYSWFDTAVNAYLIEQGVLDVEHGQTIGLVIETRCNYFAPLAFPQTVEAGIRVAQLGSSSVRYEVGLFAQGQALSAARGHFVHVYVNRETRRPTALPANLKTVLETLL
jgi:acyl-CoA thioester hydrolase